MKFNIFHLLFFAFLINNYYSHSLFAMDISFKNENEETYYNELIKKLSAIVEEKIATEQSNNEKDKTIILRKDNNFIIKNLINLLLPNLRELPQAELVMLIEKLDHLDINSTDADQKKYRALLISAVTIFIDNFLIKYLAESTKETFIATTLPLLKKFFKKEDTSSNIANIIKRYLQIILMGTQNIYSIGDCLELEGAEIFKDNSPLKELDLSNKKISSLEGIENIPNSVEYLYLNDNPLFCFQEFPNEHIILSEYDLLAEFINKRNKTIIIMDKNSQKIIILNPLVESDPNETINIQGIEDTQAIPFPTHLIKYSNTLEEIVNTATSSKSIEIPEATQAALTMIVNCLSKIDLLVKQESMFECMDFENRIQLKNGKFILCSLAAVVTPLIKNLHLSTLADLIKIIQFLDITDSTDNAFLLETTMYLFVEKIIVENSLFTVDEPFMKKIEPYFLNKKGQPINSLISLAKKYSDPIKLILKVDDINDYIALQNYKESDLTEASLPLEKLSSLYTSISLNNVQLKTLLIEQLATQLNMPITMNNGKKISPVQRLIIEKAQKVIKVPALDDNNSIITIEFPLHLARMLQIVSDLLEDVLLNETENELDLATTPFEPYHFKMVEMLRNCLYLIDLQIKSEIAHSPHHTHALNYQDDGTCSLKNLRILIEPLVNQYIHSYNDAIDGLKHFAEFINMISYIGIKIGENNNRHHLVETCINIFAHQISNNIGEVGVGSDFISQNYGIVPTLIDLTYEYLDLIRIGMHDKYSIRDYLQDNPNVLTVVNTTNDADLSSKNITSIDGIDLLPLATKINLQNNYIQKINPNAIKNLKHITKLELSHNYINKIERDAFANTSLKQLSLDHNSIRKLTANTFSGLPQLTTLHLGDNPLKHIDQKAFIPQETPKLTQIKLTDYYSDNTSRVFLENIASSLKRPILTEFFNNRSEEIQPKMSYDIGNSLDKCSIQ